VLIPADSEETSRLAIEMACKFDGFEGVRLFASCGVHPHEAKTYTEDTEKYLRSCLEARTEHKIMAIGEIGLDYHYDGYDRDKQIRFFREQLAFANELDMPVIVHSRDAAEDTVEILREYRPKGVVHCFSGSAETAKEILKLGMYIGFTGVLTFKNAKKALKALAEVPMDKLLMETDCPYMAPEPFRGKRCDSSMIAYTAAKAAEIKGMTTQELIDITCQNGMTMYGIQI
jgi:TatD DNase family protein